MKHTHQSHRHSHDHTINNKKKLLIVIIFNIIITIAEYIGGILSGSLALISDAGHNLSDVLSLILGYTGEKVSEKQPSKKYTFGLKRFEVLIAFINALSLILIGIYIIYESIQRYLHPVPIKTHIMIPIAVIGLLGNVFSILVLSANKHSNLNMKAAFLHLFYDAISSVAVIAAGIVYYFNKIYVIDLIISLFIVIMLFWSSFGIIKESLRIFLQGAPSHIDTDEVYKNILSCDNVVSVHSLHIWSINSIEVFLSCHICISKENSVDTDSIIRNINNMLENKYTITNSAIQIEIDTICKT